MSNKVVSPTYRSIIDDVIANARQDFEEMGIEKEVLEELQRSWEARLVATGVTDFEGAPVVPRPSARKAEEAKKDEAEVKPDVSGEGSAAKTEGGAEAAKDNNGEGSSGDAAVAGAAAGSSSNKSAKREGAADATADRGDDQNRRDEEAGANGGGGEGSAQAGSKRKRPEMNSDEIGSDLDDSDDDVDNGADGLGGDANGEGGADGDTVLCLYEKVNRVRNRWKCVLKDGVANIDGRDYLFSRCNTEFEW
ncbi:unnamed protein product [Jaminaea pallidilutea]